MSRDRRMAQLATIHIGRKRLGMAEEVYRDLVERISGQHGMPHRTAADLSPRQLAAVITEFGRLGFNTERPVRGKPHNFATLPEYITRIEALLVQCNASWAYADAIARQMFGVERVAWCTQPQQLKNILVALDYERKKQALARKFDALALADKADPEQLARELGGPSNWRRSLPWLKKLITLIGIRRGAELRKVET